MSTLKCNNAQIGQSVTATNNMTWYQPSSPDGTVRLGVGNTGATTLDVIAFTNAGKALVGSSSSVSTNALLQVNSPANFKGYTVATLPAGSVGDRAYVTDALTAVFQAVPTGGGSVKTPVFYNGSNWVCG